MASLKDVAQAAGVATSTVSRVLNGTASISEGTRQRVLEAAEALRYRKRRTAPGSAPLRRVAGIIIPDMASDYYSRLVHTLNECFRQNGYATLFSVTDFDEKAAIRSIEHMAQIRVSCLLIVMDDIEAVSQKLIDSVRLTLLPVMFVRSRHIDLLEADCLFVDEEHGNTLAVEHLLRRGYKRIGFIGERNTMNRYQQFQKTMRRHGAPINRRFARIGDERGELGGYLRMKELLESTTLPDAIYASYDQMAIGAIHALNEAGLRVPGDVAVIGFDNIPISRYIAGGLTTIGTPFEDMASIAVRVLLHRVASPYGETQQIALKPRLVVRATT